MSTVNKRTVITTYISQLQLKISSNRASQAERSWNCRTVKITWRAGFKIASFGRVVLISFTWEQKISCDARSKNRVFTDAAKWDEGNFRGKPALAPEDDKFATSRLR